MEETSPNSIGLESCPLNVPIWVTGRFKVVYLSPPLGRRGRNDRYKPGQIMRNPNPRRIQLDGITGHLIEGIEPDGVATIIFIATRGEPHTGYVAVDPPSVTWEVLHEEGLPERVVA